MGVCGSIQPSLYSPLLCPLTFVGAWTLLIVGSLCLFSRILWHFEISWIHIERHYEWIHYCFTVICWLFYWAMMCWQYRSWVIFHIIFFNSWFVLIHDSQFDFVYTTSSHYWASLSNAMVHSSLRFSVKNFQHHPFATNKPGLGCY